MVKKEFADIKYVSTIAYDTVEMTLENEYIAKHANPGQFVHVLGTNHTLSRATSIADVDPKNSTITMLFIGVGLGTNWLAALRSGDVLDLLGPCGNGLHIDHFSGQTALLIGGG